MTRNSAATPTTRLFTVNVESEMAMVATMAKDSTTAVNRLFGQIYSREEFIDDCSEMLW